MDTEADSTPEPLFRSVKKRKFLRRRPDHDQETQENTPETSNENGHDAAAAAGSTTEETADVVRLRRPQRVRKGGIEFSTTTRQTADNGSGSGSQAVEAHQEADEGDETNVLAMCDRFTAHTGQTVDVDKHMMDYIETEMAKRNRRDLPTETSDPESQATDAKTANDGPAGASNFARREPATIGKLHEIDLGQEAKMHNIARTEAATRRLAGDEATMSMEEDSSTAERTTGAGGEKDGKAWRNRKRRNSKDIERDRLVEEVLRESKLDVYDEPDDEPELLGDDQAADDRIAERFRRDFMDAIQSRRRTRNATANTTKQRAKPEAPRGPKLGGSRSARAAMRESQKAQK